MLISCSHRRGKALPVDRCAIVDVTFLSVHLVLTLCRVGPYGEL